MIFFFATGAIMTFEAKKHYAYVRITSDDETILVLILRDAIHIVNLVNQQIVVKLDRSDFSRYDYRGDHLVLGKRVYNIKTGELVNELDVPDKEGYVERFVSDTNIIYHLRNKEDKESIAGKYLWNWASNSLTKMECPPETWNCIEKEYLLDHNYLFVNSNRIINTNMSTLKSMCTQSGKLLGIFNYPISEIEHVDTTKKLIIARNEYEVFVLRYEPRILG